jgi:DNA-binding transcriptional LysR family regulator
LEEIDEAETRASGEYTVPRGELTITAPIVFGRLHVLPVINDFLEDFGEITVRLRQADQNIDLLDEHIDLAVRIGDLPNSSLMATRVGVIRRVVCGSPSYLAIHGTPRTPDDLARHACVTFSAMASGASWAFKSGGRQAKLINPPCRLHVNTAEAAVDAAIAGIGITNVLSYQVARAVEDGQLRIVLAEFEPALIPVHMVHAHHGLLPLKMRCFLEFAAPRLRKSLLSAHMKLGSSQ